MPWTMGYLSLVTNKGRFSTWSSTVANRQARSVTAPEDTGRPSITSRIRMVLSLEVGIENLLTKAWSINAIPDASQSIRPEVTIDFPLTVIVIGTTKCSPERRDSSTDMNATENADNDK